MKLELLSQPFRPPDGKVWQKAKADPHGEFSGQRSDCGKVAVKLLEIIMKKWNTFDTSVQRVQGQKEEKLLFRGSGSNVKLMEVLLPTVRLRFVQQSKQEEETAPPCRSSWDCGSKRPKIIKSSNYEILYAVFLRLIESWWAQKSVLVCFFCPTSDKFILKNKADQSDTSFDMLDWQLAIIGSAIDFDSFCNMASHSSWKMGFKDSNMCHVTGECVQSLRIRIPFYVPQWRNFDVMASAREKRTKIVKNSK